MKKINLRILLGFCFLLSANMLMAQTKIINGTVTTSNGEPLPGVTIIVGTTTQGGITNNDGEYSIEVPTDAEFLVFSFIGMKSEKVTIKSQNEINVTLNEDFIGLEEVVAVGYAKVKKSDLTGAVSSMKPKDLNLGGNVTNVGQMLQGRVTGLYVNSHNQDPGATPEFILRGASSFQEGEAGQPLVVVDGFPMENTSYLNTVNPDDIAQIDVLKDASATAIYGSRGANGVIMITTKTGVMSGIQIDYNMKLSTQLTARTIELMDADQYARFYFDLAHDPDLSISGYGPGDEPHGLDEIGNLPNTDWQDELINKNNLTQEHNFSIAGVSSGVKYRISTSYYNGKAIVSPSGYERFNTMAKISFERKRFSVKTDFNFTSQNINNVRNSYENAVKFSPSSPIYDETGELSSHASENLAYMMNPLFNETALEDFTETNTFRINSGLSYEFIDGLRLELNAAITQSNPESFSQRFKPSYASQEATSGSLSKESQRTIYADYFLKYVKTYAQHNLSVMAGGAFNSYRNRGISASSVKFPYKDIAYYNIDAGLEVRQMGSFWFEKKVVSGLARLNYNYASKYYLTVNYRLDGATQFGENNKWGGFPSASVAYRVDQENFFKDNVDFLKTLKIRVGYGSAGNANIAPYRTQRLIDFRPTYTGVIGNGIQWVGDYKPNPDLHWETSKTLNLGLEFGNNKFYAEFDLYNKKSEDLLLDRQVPTESGFSSITLNRGEMLNRGIEGKLNLFLDFFGGDLRWSPGIWFSMNENEITDLNDDIILGNSVWLNRVSYGYTNIKQKGYPLNAIWGYDFLGVWQEDEAAEASKYNSEPGDPKFADLNGMDDEGNIITGPDGEITDADLKYIGDANPKFTAGLFNRFNYKNFEFSFFIDGVFDKTVVNSNKAFFTYPSFTWGANRMIGALDRWTPDHPSNNTPSLTRSATDKIVRSTWTIEDASFVRIREVTLSYRFNLEEGNIFKNLKLYASMTNLYTFTNYTGLNPDVSFNDGVYNLRPFTHTVTFGINASF